MSKERIKTVADAVYKIQLALFGGIQDEGHLLAAGALMSRNDYQDIVSERSFSELCGYPLCSNALPSERPRKGHYRISLKEHKVYDLHETYMYCSSSCLINSRAFAGSLKDQRCSVMSPAKLNEILSLFENVGAGFEEEMGKSGDLGLSKLRIQENAEVKGGEVSLEEWMGPSNAIEGYVPKRDRNSESSLSKASKKGSESGSAKVSKDNDNVQKKADFEVAFTQNKDTTGPRKAPEDKKFSRTNHSSTSKPLLDEMDFMSTIITNDEYTVSKRPDGDSKPVSSSAAKEGSKSKKSGSKKGKTSMFNGVDFMSTIINEDEYSISKLPSSQAISDPNQIPKEFVEKLALSDAGKQLKALEESSGSLENVPPSSVDSAVIETGVITNVNSDLARSFDHSQNDADSSSAHMKDECSTEQAVQSSKGTVKSSMRSSRRRKEARSVTWADEKNNGPDGGTLCNIREFSNMEEGPSTSRESNNMKEAPRTVSSKEAGDHDDSQRFASAEACAMAMTQAAEVVASGQSDATDAVSEAGIIVLPNLQEPDEGEDPMDDESVEKDAASRKWPKKPGNLNSDLFDSDDSWFDAAPEGFSLTLSPFATMWNALFSWVTSSSLAYIYGRDESSHEEYLFVNGREYPGKVMLPDGRSSEIKQTLAGCLARALPGVIAVLKLPTPISTLEQGLACLLDTMSFMDPLPPFRLKQWQVIILLLIDALSICRIPGLAPYLTSRRILIPKVLDGAQLSAEEYEIMRDLVIPLGRVPQFTMQSGG